MKKIEIQMLNYKEIEAAEAAMLVAARLTQRGHKINDMNDFLKLYDKPVNKELVENLCALPHATLQKFGVVNVMVVGLSRRALAQITRHQNEVKFMAGSLQYSNYAEAQRFVMPPGLTDDQEETLRSAYEVCAQVYDALINSGASPDAAGYVMPQGFRTALFISATPFEWKHMIRQRTCKRNTPEVAYLMGKIGEELQAKAPELFHDLGPDCTRDGCREGRMACGQKARTDK